MAQVTHEEICARAEQLAPRLRERARRCDEIGMAPPETMAELTDAGITRITQPARFGGAALGWDTVCEVGRILATGCGSQAWVNNILNDHGQQLGTFALAAQEDVWGKSPAARVCGSVEPTGRGEKAPGGVRFTGRHSFASGIDHAQWVVCGGFRYDGDKQLARAFFLVPTSEIEILDDWRVMGLGGTGSKTFLVKDRFVPEHRIMDARPDELAPGPGVAANPAAIFRLPRASAASSAFAAIATGIAQGCLDAWLDHTAGRNSRGVAMAAQPGTQITGAHAAAEIEAARRMAVEPVRELMRTLEAGRAPTVPELRTLKLSAAYAATLARGAVERLAASAGARGLFDGSQVQRALRDVYMATAQFSLNWDQAAIGWASDALAARTKGK